MKTRRLAAILVAGLATVLVAAGLAAVSCRRERDILGNPIDGTHRVSVFAVLDEAGRTLWKFSTPPPGARFAEKVDYGRLPAGFAQDVPEGGAAPRPFRIGEKLTVVIVSPEYVYRGDCVATDSPTEPKCSSWSSARPDRDTVDRALRGEGIGEAGR